MKRPLSFVRSSSSQVAPVCIVTAALACLSLPKLSPALALAGGIAIAVTLGNPFLSLTKQGVRHLLPLSVVALGGGMDLGAVVRVGVRGIGFTVVSISICLALGTLIARALRVERRVGALVTVGTAICGGSAIAAAAPVLDAEEQEVSVALGTVFLLNAIALLVFPAVGHWVGLSQQAFGLWAALAIHDTSSVVGATLRYGAIALAVGTTVKLARALWIVPVTFALGWRARQRGEPSRRRVRVPWFILGFLAVAAITTWLPILRPAGRAVAELGHRTLVLTLLLVGLGLSRQGLKSVRAGPFVLGVILWITMAAGTLGAVEVGWIHL